MVLALVTIALVLLQAFLQCRNVARRHHGRCNAQFLLSNAALFKSFKRESPKTLMQILPVKSLPVTVVLRASGKCTIAQARIAHQQTMVKSSHLPSIRTQQIIRGESFYHTLLLEAEFLASIHEASLGRSCLEEAAESNSFTNSPIHQFTNSLPYCTLLGLLAKIKCRICSYQFNV